MFVGAHRRRLRAVSALFALALLLSPMAALGHEHHDAESSEHCVVCAHLVDPSCDTAFVPQCSALEASGRPPVEDPRVLSFQAPAFVLGRGPPTVE
ncbi:MAG: hypothetical protein AAGA81_03380 [Acidobacteriota bacterium]